MSAQNFIATQRDIACVRDTITGLQAFYRAVALHLNDLYQSQESTTIGQMRNSVLIAFDEDNEDQSVKKARQRWLYLLDEELKEEITKIRLHAIPVISNEGDTVEFGYSEWEQFQQRDLIPVKVQNGPFMVKLEVVYDEQYIGSLMKTFLFEENSETFLLTEIIDKVENFVLQHSTSGVDILSLDFDDVKQACHGLQYGGLSVEQVNISKFLAMTNCRPTSPPTIPRILNCPLQDNQIITTHMLVEVTLSDAQKLSVGFADVILVKSSPVSIAYSHETRPYVIIPRLRSWKDSPIWILTFYFCPSPYNPFYLSGDTSDKFPEPGSASYDSTISRYDNALSVWETIAGFEPIDVCLLILKSLKGREKLAFDHLWRMAWLLINYTDPSRKSLSTEDLRNWLSKHSRKYAFSKKDLSDRKAYYANYKVRTGTWEDEVDGEALRKARDVLAKVTSREVAILGRENYADIFPPTLQHPVRGTMKLYSNGEPKEMTLRALWYLYSKRSNPWTIINAKVADSFKKGYNMIASHIKNPTNHIEARRVRWAVQADLQKGIQILNNAANSPDEPFATLQIAQNDWKTWRTLLARSHREANATKVEMIAYIGNRIKEEFPGVVLSRETRNNLVYNLIDKLATEAARKAAGKTGLDYNYWSLQEQALVAVCLYVLGEAPVDPTQPLEVYPVGLANAIQLVLPTRTHSSISKALEEKSVGITRCYELLEQTIQEEGLQFLGSQLSAQTLRELEEYGYGRSNNN